MCCKVSLFKAAIIDFWPLGVRRTPKRAEWQLIKLLHLTCYWTAAYIQFQLKRKLSDKISACHFSFRPTLVFNSFWGRTIWLFRRYMLTFFFHQLVANLVCLLVYVGQVAYSELIWGFFCWNQLWLSVGSKFPGLKSARNLYRAAELLIFFLG